MKYQSKTITPEDMDRMRIMLAVQPHIGEEPSCDFCGAANPVVVYAADQTSTGELRECWRWCACADCQKYIDKGQFGPIALKIAKWTRTKVPGLGFQEAFTCASKALEEFHDHAIEERCSKIS